VTTTSTSSVQLVEKNSSLSVVSLASGLPNVTFADTRDAALGTAVGRGLDASAEGVDRLPADLDPPPLQATARANAHASATSDPAIFLLMPR
jgi:hypothetical protein